jgi:hypothetical protein
MCPHCIAVALLAMVAPVLAVWRWVRGRVRR